MVSEPFAPTTKVRLARRTRKAPCNHTRARYKTEVTQKASLRCSWRYLPSRRHGNPVQRQETRVVLQLFSYARTLLMKFYRTTPASEPWTLAWRNNPSFPAAVAFDLCSCMRQLFEEIQHAVILQHAAKLDRYGVWYQKQKTRIRVTQSWIGAIKMSRAFHKTSTNLSYPESSSLSWTND